MSKNTAFRLLTKEAISHNHLYFITHECRNYS